MLTTSGTKIIVKYLRPVEGKDNSIVKEYYSKLESAYNSLSLNCIAFSLVGFKTRIGPVSLNRWTTRERNPHNAFRELCWCVFFSSWKLPLKTEQSSVHLKCNHIAVRTLLDIAFLIGLAIGVIRQTTVRIDLTQGSESIFKFRK